MRHATQHSENNGHVFSHNKKNAIYLLLVFILSFFITALPLAMMQYVGFDMSFSIMIGIEFVVAVLFYMCIMRSFPECGFTVRIDNKSLKISITLLLTLLSIQTFSYISGNNIYHYEPVRPSIFSILTLVLVIPFYEEVFYRGCLFGFICSVYRKGVLLPSVVTSLVFSLMHTQHYDIMSQCIYFFMALIFVYVRVKTR